MKFPAKLIIVILLTFALLPINVFASKNIEKSADVIFFEDGSYITVDLLVWESRSSAARTASKNYTFRGAGGIEEWRATLTATFIYDGMTAACTDARCEVSITDTDWYVISKTADATGDTAAAYVTMGRKMAGVTVERKSVELSIICDGVGNLS